MRPVTFRLRYSLPLLSLLIAGFCLVLSAGCKQKDPDPILTTVRGSVTHKYLEQALANQKVTVLGLRRIVANFSSYVEEREAAVAYTDAQGEFIVTYPDSVKSDSFVVVVRAFEKDGRMPVYKGDDNVVQIRVYDQPVLALDIFIRNNNQPPMSVLPDGKIVPQPFSVNDVNADLTKYYKVDPQTTYDFLFRYNESKPAGQRSLLFRSTTTGPFTDTFHASMTADANNFAPY